MHSFLKSITITLLPLILTKTPPTTALTPSQADLGKVPGYLGAASAQHNGDSLTSTFCYCSTNATARAASPHDPSLAHVYTIEYYNLHRDATYILTSVCRAHHTDTRDAMERCYMYENDAGVQKAEGWWREEGFLEHSWPVPGRGKARGRGKGFDRLRYTPASYMHGRFPFKNQPSSAWLEWNRQMRNVGEQGGQGWRGVEGGEVQEYCGGVCGNFVGMEVGVNRFEHGVGLPSHRVVCGEVDDMCDGCK